MEQWFSENERYKKIIPKIDLIINLIDSANEAQKQKSSIAETLSTTKALLITYQEQMINLEKQSEELNQLLPSEVLMLRNRLSAGTPCVVCGSIHHPYKDEIEQDRKINEEELEQSKQKIQERIEKGKIKIEQTQKKYNRV